MVLRATYPDAGSGWQPHRATITRLYRDEGRPLKEVMVIMAEERGFKATTKMYKSRIARWGLDKKNKRHEVKEILWRRASRWSLGKESEFILRGQIVDMADVERYAGRAGLALYPDHCSPTEPGVSPLSLGSPASLRNIEHFLHSFNVFVRDSLHSGLWKLGKDVMGFACIVGVEFPISPRDRFFLSIERGVRRYKVGDLSQAYRQWRSAGRELQFVVESRRPSQLLCLVELLAYLAECKGEVANQLLQYLGVLVNKHVNHDARMAVLQSLSRLQAEDLAGLTQVSHDCSRNAFSGHFYRKSFFLLDSETILMDSNNDLDECSPQLSGLLLGWETYDVGALRAARSVMEILMAAERYEEAEQITLIHVQRMHEMQYDGVLGGAFSHAYSYLTHLYLMSQDYEKAFYYTLLKVENYFKMLEYRADLPEDFILLSFDLLSSLAKALGMDEEAEKWRRKHTNLKAHTDALAEMELSCLKSQAQASLSINVQMQQSESSPSASPEVLSATSVEDSCRNSALPVRPHPDLLLSYLQKRPKWCGPPPCDAVNNENGFLPSHTDSTPPDVDWRRWRSPPPSGEGGGGAEANREPFSHVRKHIPCSSDRNLARGHEHTCSL
ncbi:hypothetical protein A1O7_09203 [Cladophialophora yegresii CBS 114405]|uniref:Clr5 domain-containing protein n=1 Tax=Cladophialophora yegresii CBS 114405 TaxID=1182544 RepID=W9VE49_9EURO|nr:uncharacterized protein A1O7_09203 [Cladophialophora yegresii CBS 114405]EXJ53867.1 hypothetical protein A1O7_09203 [Cladophialophora yegresii CBS 114405]